MIKEDFIRARNIFKEIEELQQDINHINYVFSKADLNKFPFVIMEGSKIHITRDEMKMLVENRKKSISDLEKEFEKL